MVTDPHSVYSGHCPARVLLDRTANKWTTLIIGVNRGTDMLRSIAPVHYRHLTKMLTQTLRDLERDGLVVRTVHSAVPPRVEYSLTALGRPLKEPLGALSRWSEDHWNDVTRAQEKIDEASSRINEGRSA